MVDAETLFSMTEALKTNSDEDEDIVNENESTALGQFYIEEEKSLSLQRTYILHTSSSQGVTDRIFLGLSNFSSVVYDLETTAKVATLSGHINKLTGLKVCSGDDDLVFTSSLDGTIKLWDLRSKNYLVKECKDASEGVNRLKPITCFDISKKKTVITAGTEVFDGDSFILFWDPRSTDLLGGYWESHRDEITQVQFHPSKKNCLASGSTDGLLNIFDISEGSEDDALLYSMNTESSVDKIQWCTNSTAVDHLSCITDTEDLQLWELDDVTPVVMFGRQSITKAMLRKNSDHCYVVDYLLQSGDKDISVLVGSTAGRGECLRMLRVKNKTLVPAALFNNNKQVVRCCCYSRQNNLIITGGESGLFTIWKEDFKTTNFSNLKIKAKMQNSNKKPY